MFGRCIRVLKIWWVLSLWAVGIVFPAGAQETFQPLEITKLNFDHLFYFEIGSARAQRDPVSSQILIDGVNEPITVFQERLRAFVGPHLENATAFHRSLQPAVIDDEIAAIWPGTERSLEDYLLLTDPAAVNETALFFDRSLEQTLGETPVIAYVRDEEGNEHATLYHHQNGDLRPYTYQEAFLAYEQIKTSCDLDTESWIGSGRTKLIVELMERLLVARLQGFLQGDFSYLGVRQEIDFITSLENSYQRFTTAVANGKGYSYFTDPIVARHRLAEFGELIQLAKWFPRSYAFFVLRGDVDLTSGMPFLPGFAYARQLDKTGRGYLAVAEHWLPELYALHLEVEKAAKEAEERLWNVFVKVGRGESIAKYRQQVEQDLSLFGKRLSEEETAATDRRLQYIYTLLKDGYELPYRSFLVAMSPIDSFEGAIYRWNRARNRMDPLPIAAILSDPKKVLGDKEPQDLTTISNLWGLDPPNIREPKHQFIAKNNVEKIVKAVEAIDTFEDDILMPAFAVSTTLVLTRGIGGSTVAGMQRSASPFLSGFALGSAGYAVSTVAESIYLNKTGRPVELTWHHVLIGAGISGLAFGAAGKVLERLRRSSLPYRVAGPVFIGAGSATVSALQGDEAPKVLLTGISVAGYAYALHRLAGLRQLSPAQRFGSIFVAGTSMSAGHAYVEYKLFGYIDPLGFVATGPGDAAAMGGISMVGYNFGIAGLSARNATQAVVESQLRPIAKPRRGVTRRPAKQAPAKEPEPEYLGYDPSEAFAASSTGGGVGLGATPSHWPPTPVGGVLATAIPNYTAVPNGARPSAAVSVNELVGRMPAMNMLQAGQLTAVNDPMAAAIGLSLGEYVVSLDLSLNPWFPTPLKTAPSIDWIQIYWEYMKTFPSEDRMNFTAMLERNGAFVSTRSFTQ